MNTLKLFFIFTIILFSQSFFAYGFGIDLRMCGDCNNDSAVSVLDALLVQKIAASLEPVPGSPNFEYCNVQGILGSPSTPGAEINILDSLLIAQYSAGSLNNLDCSEKKEILYADIDLMAFSSKIRKANLDGTNDIDITPYYSGLSVTNQYLSPKFFGPNREIVFSYYFGTGNPYYGIGIMNPDGSNARSVVSPVLYLFDPDGSPDGTKIVYSLSWGLYELNLITGVERGLALAGERPEYSPDGREIVFDSSPLRMDRNIWKINSMGTGLVQLTTSGNDWNPSWSPDGTKIVFERGAYPGRTDLYTMNSDGSGQTLITLGPLKDNIEPVYTNNNQLLFSHWPSYSVPGLSSNLYVTAAIPNIVSTPVLVNPTSALKTFPNIG